MALGLERCLWFVNSVEQGQASWGYATDLAVYSSW